MIYIPLNMSQIVGSNISKSCYFTNDSKERKKSSNIKKDPI